MDALPDEDVNLDADDPSGRISSSQEEEEEEDRARGHVDDEEDIVVPDDDADTTENEQAETGESEEDPAPAEQEPAEQSQREVADTDEQQQQQQQIEVQQQQLQRQQIQQQQQQQQQQEQQYYQPQQQQPINFQPKIIIPKQKSSRRRSSGSSQQPFGVSQEDLEEKLEEASASAVGNVVDAFVGKLDNAANAARAGPKAIERSLSPMDRLTESIARILNDKEEENNKERRSSRRRYDDEDEDDYDERDRRRRRDERRRDDYDEERDYRRSDNARQSLGEPMSTEDKLNQKMRDLGVEDAIAEKQRREDDARMGEMIKQKLSLMDPDIVEDKPYLEPTRLEMNQIVERTLKKLGIEDIAKREKDTKMEEKLEQIIAEKFDKMGLNNDDDDDEEDNLAPFRKGKKASRIEKRVQKAVAGGRKQVVREHVWTAQRNQQMQPQMGVPMMQQPYGYQPQPVLYDQFGRPVVTAPQPVVQQQPQEIAVTRKRTARRTPSTHGGFV